MRRLLLALPLAAACAVTPRALTDAQRAEPLTPICGIDWDKAGDEAVRVFAEYLRVDTVNPPGNETRGAQFFADILAKEHIESKIIEFAPGRGSIIARLKGSGSEPPLCLMSHLDVVTSEASRWPEGKPPLGGVVDADGMIWGRGALDMKGLGALELMTMVWLKRLNLPLKRDVVLLGVADEEDDNRGMKFVVEQEWKNLGCGHVINEGGIGIRDMLLPGQTVYAVSVAEKGVLWLRMIAEGNAGHGSTELPGRAPERLLKAIEKLRARETPYEVHPSLYTLLREAGEQKGGVTGYVLNRPFLVRQFVVGDFLANPATRATITNTCQITGFSGAMAINVVPSEVSANVDCRVLPGVKPAEFKASLDAIIDDPKVRLEVVQMDEANASPWEDPVFAAIARRAIDGRSDVVVGPVLSPGYTDSLLLRPLGAKAYGFVPFEITKDEAGTMHGHGERVSSENVRRGLRMLIGVVVDVAGGP